MLEKASNAGRAGAFRFLVECCQWNFARAAPVRLTPPAGIDWTIFTSLARFHRVQGLVRNAFSSIIEQVPDSALTVALQDARSIAGANLLIVRECRELDREFDHATIPLLFLKGLAVAGLAYRSPMLKLSWDIDLLIAPADLNRASEILTGRGFMPSTPRSLARLTDWHRRAKESVWSRSDGVHVELHTRLADNRSLIPTLDAHSQRQDVTVAPGIVLPTLADEEHIAYLAVHGASSAWFRLKWISDFAALLEGRRGDELDRLFRRAQELGAGRAIGQAMSLADSLFNSLRDAPTLRSALSSDQRVVQLNNAAIKLLTGDPEEPTKRPFGTWPIHWTQFLLLPGLGFKLSELKRQATSVVSRAG